MAGATEVLVGSSRRWALVHELREVEEPPFAHLLTKLSPVDLVIVEGYKRERHPKLEVHRAALGAPLIAAADDSIVAIASDSPLDVKLPVIDLNDIDRIVDMLIRYAAPRDAMLAKIGCA
jgi:molybdopterin-guanine dinucleotide biosynthesis protein MobB